MQNRYAGDIGDFAKLGLLRALSANLRLGFAWYLYPDEGHNEDGRHIAYLDEPMAWKGLDPELFASFGNIVRSGDRTVAAIERANLFDEATFHSALLFSETASAEKGHTDRYGNSPWFAEDSCINQAGGNLSRRPKLRARQSQATP